MKSKLSIALFLAGTPQYQVAHSANISESRLSRIALGRINPTDEERGHIARALGMSVDELFETERPAA